MFCGKCGAKINDGDSFCTNCGARVVVNNVAMNNNSNERAASTILLQKIKNVKCISEYSDETKVDEMKTIEFGSYPQSDASGKLKELIEWIVLEKSNDSAFLISKCILDCKTYGVFDDFRIDYPCWENSILRKWLNDEFYNVAFNNSEKELIKTTRIINIPNYNYNREEKTTEDKIFCLSIEEVGKYFNQKINERDIFSESECKKLATYGTIYAKNVDNNGNKLYEEKIGMWFDNNHPFWLRSHGKEQGSASEIGSDGKICQNSYVSCNYIGVRPAMWIKI